MSEIQDNFNKDKEATLDAAQKYLNNNSSTPEIESRDYYREAAAEAVKRGDFSAALENLETLRDLKSGIVTTEIAGEPTSTIIRDARNATKPPLRGSEAHEMQYLNAIRAAIDIAETGGKPELVDQLKASANKFITEFSQQPLKNQEAYQKDMKDKITNLGDILQEGGISNAFKKMNIAKDFQNFNEKHSNIVTISSVADDNGKTHTVTETEVAMKGMLDVQRQQYEAISNGGEAPGWYDAMPPWEKALTKKYAKTIAEGQHVIPTQLRQMAGMKNAFEKTTQVMNGAGKLETVHTSKHAGTLCSLAHDKKGRQDITDNNARQAQAWLGDDKTLHCNVLNSKPGAGHDPEIVKRTDKAMQNVGGKRTNTPFNAFRYIGGATNVAGVKDTLKQIHDALPDDPEFKRLKTHLKPRGFLKRTFGIGIPKGSFAQELAALRRQELVSPEVAKTLESANSLRKSAEKVMVPIRLGDGDNGSLTVSTKLNLLTNKINRLDQNSKGLNVKTIKVEEILDMCASGKDRTGLAQHDQSAHAIANKLEMNVKDIDAQLLAGGHTAGQAGGIRAGGATIGCYGTKKENKAGLPKSRYNGIIGIVEVTANSNKIKGKNIKIKKSKAKTATPPTPQSKETVNVSQEVGAPSAPTQNKLNAQKRAQKIRRSLSEGNLSPERSSSSKVPPNTPPNNSKSSKRDGVAR